MTKYIFFDLDGTIVDNGTIISEKTDQALRALRANGHKIFVCTGRTKGYVKDPNIRKYNFDGYIYGCGTMMEYKDKPVYYYELDRKIIDKTYDVIIKNDIYAVYEGKDKLYMSFENDLFHSSHKARLDVIPKLNSQLSYACKLKQDLGDDLIDLKSAYPNIVASKVSVYIDRPEVRDEFLSVSGEWLSSISRHNTVFEMVPYGHSKGQGIIEMCKIANIDINDTICFGDSNNDIEMFKTTKLSICMGNGTDLAKENASYVTNGIKDGIYDACKHFDLI